MTGSQDPGDKYFYNRDVFTWKFSTQWLAAKRLEDDCGGLWRIHDDLYDLTGWAKHHPGEARQWKYNETIKVLGKVRKGGKGVSLQWSLFT